MDNKKEFSYFQTSGIHDGDLNMFLLEIEIDQIAKSKNRSCLVADLQVSNKFLNLKFGLIEMIISLEVLSNFISNR